MAAARRRGLLRAERGACAPIELEPDLLIVNRLEHEVVSRGKLVAVTYGRRGRRALRERPRGRARHAAACRRRRRHRGGRRVRGLSRRLAARRPRRGRGTRARMCRRGTRGIAPRRTTFTPHADDVDSDTRRMTPTPIILDCDPGHDDAIAILLALASPELELVGVTTVSGNQTLDKTTNNALRCSSSPAAPTSPSTRAPTRRSSGSTTSPRTSTASRASTGPTCRAARAAQAQHAVDFLADQIRGATASRHARPDRAADEHRPALLAASRRAARAHRPDGRRDRRGQPDAGRRVQHLGRPRGGSARLHGGPRHDDGRARRHPPRADQGRAHRTHARRRGGSARSSRS